MGTAKKGGNGMNIKYAIEVLKYLSKSIKIGGGKSLIYTRDAEAIDMVVEYCEKQLPCDCVIGFEGDIPVTHKLCDNCKSKIWE